MDTISRSKLLLVEGQDEVDVCHLLLRNIDPNYAQQLDVQTGKDDKKKDLMKLASALDVATGFDQLQKLAILVDAEETPDLTYQKWQAFKEEFEATHEGKSCEVLILPSSTQKGSLESIFVAALQEGGDAIAQCASSFIQCVGDRGQLSTQARRDKAQLICYINANSSNPYSRIGVALSQQAKDLFDFEHPSFNTLKNFLQRLL